MHIYLKGYYGYQNLGDECLLIGLLFWLEKEYSPKTIYVESSDLERLNNWLEKSKKTVKTQVDIVAVVKHTKDKHPCDLICFGGGEVTTDARPFPYNGWNYLINYRKDIIFGKTPYIVVGGIGTKKKRGTTWLLKKFLGNAQRVVVRDRGSYDVAKRYFQQVELYHDFCYDLLDTLDIKKFALPQKAQEEYIIININKYIRNKSTEEKIQQFIRDHQGRTSYFFPAARGSDDLFYSQIQQLVPGCKLYDRRFSSIEEICMFVAGAQGMMAARLHILLLGKYFNIPFEPLVYQEKVQKVILDETIHDEAS